MKVFYLKWLFPQGCPLLLYLLFIVFAFHCFFIDSLDRVCFNPIFLLLSCLLFSSLCFIFPCIWVLVVCTQQYLLLQSPLMFTDQAQQDVIMVLKFPSNSPVTHVAANTQPGLATPAVITVTANRLFAVNKWHNLPGK